MHHMLTHVRFSGNQMSYSTMTFKSSQRSLCDVPTHVANGLSIWR
jgi:hypothetical protein